MPLLAKHIPASHGAAREYKFIELQFPDPLRNFWIVGSRLADPAKIAFHIRSKNGYADAAEYLGHHLQRYRFPGPRGSSHEAMPIGHSRQQINWFLTLRDQEWCSHKLPSPQPKPSRLKLVLLQRL